MAWRNLAIDLYGDFLVGGLLAMVNRESARIFNRVLESWIRSKSGKKFAEILWAKNMRIRVYHGRI
jgi:hypothetical protein